MEPAGREYTASRLGLMVAFLLSLGLLANCTRARGAANE